MLKTILDFIVIGAQKSGTTSLFRYLQKHPEIFLPKEKESPIFTEPNLTSEMINHYFKEHFHEARNEQLWGTVTPQYMSDPSCAIKIKAAIPDVKLIAMLRNPIDRAISQYKMDRRLNLTLTIEDAFKREIDKQIAVSSDYQTGENVNEFQGYIAWGEYGRILSQYFEIFDKTNILVVFFDHFTTQLEITFDRILAFLGLPCGFRPDNFEKKYFVSGKERFPNLVPRLKNTPFHRIWRLIPKKYRTRIFFRLYDLNTIRKEPDHIEISEELRNELIAYYRTDICLLEKMLLEKVPWSDFHNEYRKNDEEIKI